ncbi:MAG TPA: amino acid adenylation domain-containing protein, partial [Candidatus Kapabacteria bacterium]|nr:amino acid adenylation domain-containing protein [Candidatus Kapabacteria bacterium]
FREFLRDVKERLLLVFENQEYPFEELVDKLLLPRDIGRNPLFDVMIVLQNMNIVSTEQAKATVQADSMKGYQNIAQAAQFDLSLTAMESSRGLFLYFEYCTRLFKKETIERFILYFKKIAALVVQNPDLKIKDIEIISTEEKKQIMLEFNQTAAAYPHDKTIMQLFAEQAEKSPDHIALIGPVQPVQPVRPVRPLNLTYRQLNEQSGRLAGVLTEKGVLADHIVAIMMERSIEMITGILGILKSGGAYLPIDPKYPQERIDYMLKDSAAKILLTVNDMIFNYHQSSAIIPHSSPSNLAYIIYTSGTTGKPKGVMIEHRGMVNHIYAKINDLQLDESSIIAQNASQMFDISVWQFFTALIIGGKTVVIPNEIILEPLNFMAHVLENHITILEVVPSYLATLLDISTGEYASLYLHYLLVTGEAVNPELLKKWFLKYPGIKVVNAYGPTEASDDITHYIMDKAPEMGQVPIGSPVQNMNIYILDKYMNICPIGVNGELMVAGTGVGRGYLNRPELTAEKFQFNRSYRSNKTNILYKTGDLARWLDDGNIEFLGRIDQQVKIRGFRIELEEIENMLAKHADIKEAVVAARKDKAGHNSLCCYFTAEKEFTVSELRNYLSEGLPNYMVPAYFIPLEKIPLTPNGKIDRKNLPDPESIALDSDAAYTPPRNEIEKTMADIWQEVLGINKISIDDNYFAIGGDSINSILIISRMKKAGYLIEMKDIFQHPRISELGALVKKIEIIREQTIITTSSYSMGKEITPGDLTYRGLSFESFKQWQEKYSYLIEDIYTLSPMQEMILFYTLYEGKNRPLYFLQESFRFNSVLNVPLFEKSLAELIKRHSILRTAFIYEGLNRPLQVVLKERNLDFYFEDLRESMPTFEDKVTFVREFMEKDRQRSFDLGNDVLMRLTVLQLADADYQVTWSSHHILMDGWCMGILRTEFSEIYTAYLGNRDIQLPEVKPYRIYIQWLEQQDKNKTKNYWKNYLEGYDDSAILPRKKGKEKFQGGFKFAAAFTRFSEEKTNALKKVAIRSEVTLNTLIQAVWAIVLGKYNSKQDVVFGMLASGRPSEIEGVDSMVGCFINTVPVRINFNNQVRFNELLRIVRDRAVESEIHHYFSLAEIQAESTLKQNLLDHIIQFQNFPIAKNKESHAVNEIKENEAITMELSELNAFEQGGDYNFYVLITPLDKIDLGFYYNANLYDKETIEQLGFNCIRVLDQIIENEKAVIVDIAILSEDEKRKLLFEFNNNRADFPREKTIYRMIEEHAGIAPDRIAVNEHLETFSGTATSYKELNRGANRLAIWLKNSGIQKDEPVGILMERSAQMIVSILAVWKAGGAYIPLDT